MESVGLNGIPAQTTSVYVNLGCWELATQHFLHMEQCARELSKHLSDKVHNRDFDQSALDKALSDYKKAVSNIRKLSIIKDVERSMQVEFFEWDKNLHPWPETVVLDKKGKPVERVNHMHTTAYLSID